MSIFINPYVNPKMRIPQSLPYGYVPRIKITDVNTEEFKYSNHKLIQLDNLLQKELNKSVIVHHNWWYIHHCLCSNIH